MTESAKIDTLFLTKTAEIIRFGAAHTYIAYIREYPPPRSQFHPQLSYSEH